MPKPYPREFRDDVVRVARNRDDGITLEQIAADFGVHPMTLSKWMRQADVDDGARPGTSTSESAELRYARRRIKLLEQENEVLRPGRGLFIAVQPAGNRLYPLVSELAADGIPVAVTCRVLKLARQPYYRWLSTPVTDTEIIEAYRANALFDAHEDDPEFGYRFLVDEARTAEATAERTAWRICSQHRLWSVFGKKRGKNGKVGPPVQDDLVERDFTAEVPNQLWLADITEHPTREGKLYLCAIKDVFSNRIVGYCIDSPDEVTLGDHCTEQRSGSPR